MEMSLHRTLKLYYAGEPSQCEVRVGPYRIDALRGNQLVEIQHASLAAIRSKVAYLLTEGHQVLVAKPIVRRKLLVQCTCRGGPPAYRRYSPRKGTWVEVFAELVYFRGLFPHPNLTVEVIECDVEEWRIPRRRKRTRPWHPNHLVQDQRLLKIVAVYRLQDRASLQQVLPGGLPDPFHTNDLATALSIPRWLSQKIVYVLRHAGTIRPVGKLGHSRLYRQARAA